MSFDAEFYAQLERARTFDEVQRLSDLQEQRASERREEARSRSAVAMLWLLAVAGVVLVTWVLGRYGALSDSLVVGFAFGLGVSALLRLVRILRRD